MRRASSHGVRFHPFWVLCVHARTARMQDAVNRGARRCGWLGGIWDRGRGRWAGAAGPARWAAIGQPRARARGVRRVHPRIVTPPAARTEFERTHATACFPIRSLQPQGLRVLTGFELGLPKPAPTRVISQLQTTRKFKEARKSKRVLALVLPSSRPAPPRSPNAGLGVLPGHARETRGLRRYRGKIHRGCAPRCGG